MNQQEKATLFKKLHIKGNPLIIYNVWDLGSAHAVVDGGAKAIGTGSWSVAAVRGYDDGEKMPLTEVVDMTKHLTTHIDLPVTIDFEGGYAVEPENVAKNVSKLIESGAVGINFEDQKVGTDLLYDIKTQCLRINAIRNKAYEMEIPFFINARTDYFLKNPNPDDHEDLLPYTIERATAYAEAGANGFFVPGLMNKDLIAELCDKSPLPVNIMMKDGVPDVATLAKCGVARVSHGPFPYIKMMQTITENAKEAFSY